MYLVYFLVISLLSFIREAESSYPSCKDVVDTGKLNSVVIESCEASSVCTLTKGTTKSIELKFTPSTDSDTLSTHVFGLIAGIDIPYPGFKINACDPSLNIECPLKANQEYTYKNVFRVLPAYPTLDTQVKFHLKDYSGNTIVCFLVDVTIKEQSG